MQKQCLDDNCYNITKQFAKEHIEGSIHAVCDFNVTQTTMLDIPRDVKIVIIDENGARS